MSIEPLKQSAPVGCFVTCYGMLKSHFREDYSFDEEEELELLKQSFSFHRELYKMYLIDDLAGFLPVEVFVQFPDTEKAYSEVQKSLDNEVPVTFEVLSQEKYKNRAETGLMIVLLDKWDLDMKVHYVHSVLVTDYQNEEFILNDPWTGERMRVGEDTFFTAVEELKERLEYAPMVVYIDEEA